MNMPLNEIRSKYKQARAETKTYATETFVGHSNSIWGKPKLFKMPGKCRFNNAWLRNEKYMSWVSSDKDPGRAKCRLCGDKTFDISNMGEAALTSHAKGAKHQSAAASGAAPAFSPPQPGQLLRQTARLSLWSTAEVMWALKVANSHYSFKSYEDASLLFQRMFPDSQIATQFACGESKCSFLCSFGLAPHFRSLTLSNVMKQRAYVILFDESLNSYLQSKQMDLHVRLCDGADVKTKYIVFYKAV